MSIHYIDPIIPRNIKPNVKYSVSKKNINCSANNLNSTVTIQFYIENKDRLEEIEKYSYVIFISLKLVGIKTRYNSNLHKYEVLIIDNYGKLHRNYFFGDINNVIVPYVFFKKNYSRIKPLDNKILFHIRKYLDIKKIKDFSIESRWYNDLYSLQNESFYFDRFREKYDNLKKKYNELYYVYQKSSNEKIILQKHNEELLRILSNIRKMTSFISSSNGIIERKNKLNKQKQIDFIIEEARKLGLSLQNNEKISGVGSTDNEDECEEYYEYYEEQATICITQINKIIEGFLVK
jgi:hypothetical protein